MSGVLFVIGCILAGIGVISSPGDPGDATAVICLGLAVLCLFGALLTKK